MNINEIIKKMTLEEKAAMCSGKNFWNTQEVLRLDVKSMTLTDGPHGLRKQAGVADHVGLNESVPATCFPTASTTANSFDRGLLREVGEAIAEECIAEEVGLILGPGLNIKRSPLCGRNFEYFSEDPCLSGEMAAAMVEGIQSKNVGACLKHFACNSQEKARMVSDSVVDERALREIYLSAFERAIKKSKPWSIMCSYNKINGVYAAQNKKLLTEIARDEWGFDGVVVSDWGAVNNIVADIEAGLDLEMPSSNGEGARQIISAVNGGTLSMEVLDKAVVRILDMIDKAESREKAKTFDIEAHHELARRVARESAVLLKNDKCLLPLRKKDKIAIIGKLAKETRFQGGGSSAINPTKVDNALASFEKAGIDFEYSDGYDYDYDCINIYLIKQAEAIAKNKDAVIIFAGLPNEFESEGFDRSNIKIPQAMTELIEKISAINDNVVVVLLHGSVVDVSCLKHAKAALSMSLGGQAVGSAVADLIYGEVSPSGRLAETYIKALSDSPVSAHYGEGKNAVYKESIFVGYRYYQTAKKAVAYPFGYGLSYSEFEYSGLKLDKDKLKKGESVEVSVKVKNKCKIAAAEVVQVYVAPPCGKIVRPVRELKNFDKAMLKSCETKEIKMQLSWRDFAYYDVESESWQVEEGEHCVQICRNANEVIAEKMVFVESCMTAEEVSALAAKRMTVAEMAEQLALESDKEENILPKATPEEVAKAYKNFILSGEKISDRIFEGLIGCAIPKEEVARKGTYSFNSTLGEIAETKIGKEIYDAAIKEVSKQVEGNAAAGTMIAAMFEDMPVRAFVMVSGGKVKLEFMDAILDLINGKWLTGLIKIKKLRKEEKDSKDPILTKFDENDSDIVALEEHILKLNGGKHDNSKKED